MTSPPLIAYSTQLSIDRKWIQRVCAGFLFMAVSTLITIALNSLWEIPYWYFLATGKSGSFFLPFFALTPVVLLSEVVDWIGTVVGVWLVSSRILAQTEQRSTLMIWILRASVVAYQTWRIGWRFYIFAFHGTFGWHWTIFSILLALVVFGMFFMVARNVLEFCGLRRLRNELFVLTVAMMFMSVASSATSWFTYTFFGRSAATPGSGIHLLPVAMGMISNGLQIWITVFFFRARIAIRNVAPGQAK